MIVRSLILFRRIIGLRISSSQQTAQALKNVNILKVFADEQKKFAKMLEATQELMNGLRESYATEKLWEARERKLKDDLEAKEKQHEDYVVATNKILKLQEMHLNVNEHYPLDSRNDNTRNVTTTE